MRVPFILLAIGAPFTVNEVIAVRINSDSAFDFGALGGLATGALNTATQAASPAPATATGIPAPA